MRKLLAALLALAPVPAAAQAVGTNTASPAVTGSLVVSPRPGYLLGANVVTSGSAGYLMLIDSATVPVDGAVTPARCLPVAANTGIDLNLRSAPIRFTNGIVLVFSTTGCFSKTASATAFLAGDVR
jgi:hypothetical protein